jgi:hypothetical protein
VLLKNRANKRLRAEIEDRKLAEEALQDRLAFEELASRISTRFISLSADEVDGAIEEGLWLVGDFFGVDQVI